MFDRSTDLNFRFETYITNPECLGEYSVYTVHCTPYTVQCLVEGSFDSHVFPEVVH